MQSGTRLGVYEIVAAIGAGGMGEVYRARDSSLQRDVAIKVLPDAFAGDADRAARFAREAQTLAAINHPHIAQIYGLAQTLSPGGSSMSYIAMELVDGEDLGQRLHRSAIAHEEAMAIAGQIAAALEAAHGQGIVHRDLKPANVRLRPDGVVKILDFGLAKSPESAAAGTATMSPTMLLPATQSGVILGTAAYMAPEQARGHTVDRRADIWAFGAVLYEMLSGRRAFDGPSVSDQIAAVLTREPDWTALPTATPASTRRLLERCLEKDPKRRLRDIGDIDLLLDRADPPSGASRQATPVRWLAAAMTGVAAVLAVLLARSAAPRPERRAAPVRFQIPTGLNLAESQQFSLSPDGRHLVFAGAGVDGTMRLWIRTLDALEVRPLVGTETDVVDLIPPMFWSPDSAFVAYDNRGQLKKLALSGGAAQVVCAPPGFGIGGSWNRDGVILIGNATGGIVRCPADGGASTVITSLDASRSEDAHMLPTFLPDGRHFLYLASSRTRPEYSAIYMDTIVGDAPRPARQLIAATSLGPAQYVGDSPDSPKGHVLFARGETLFAQPFDLHALRLAGGAVPVADRVSWYRDGSNFSASANGTLVYRPLSRPVVLKWFDRNGAAAQPPTNPGQFASIALSHDGRQAAVARENTARQPDQDIWIVDLNGGERRLTFDPAVEESPVWFPGDAEILYRRGHDLYAKRVDGLSPERVVYTSARQKFPTDVSPDSRWVLFQEQTLDPVRKTDLMVVPASGGASSVVVAGPLEQTQGAFSPDGRTIAYVSNESGVSEVFVQTFEPPAAEAVAGRGRVLVSKGGGSAPRWRRDGRELLYQAPDGSLVAAECNTRDVIQCSPGRTLFKVPGVQSGWGVAPDGKRFLFAVSSGTSDPEPFTVVLNWPATLASKP